MMNLDKSMEMRSQNGVDQPAFKRNEDDSEDDILEIVRARRLFFELKDEYGDDFEALTARLKGYYTLKKAQNALLYDTIEEVDNYNVCLVWLKTRAEVRKGFESYTPAMEKTLRATGKVKSLEYVSDRLVKVMA